MIPSAAGLLALRRDPPGMGELAARVRRGMFGDDVTVRALSPRHARAEIGGAEIERGGDWLHCPTWPSAAQWQPGDRVVCAVEPEQAEAWVEYLAEIAAHPPAAASLAPYSVTPAGTHRLWAIAVARLALPASIRVEARHDLIGIRVAQVALGFGADTLAGPIEADRKLPLAGATRPDENTRAGLFALVEQAGLRAVEAP